MKIRCPHCGRLGDLPERLASPPRRLRCRRCQSHFTVAEATMGEAPSRDVVLTGPGRSAANGSGAWPGLGLEAHGGDEPRSAAGLSFSTASVHFERLGAADPSSPARGPGDSQYELSCVFESEPWDDDEPDAPAPVSESGEADALATWSTSLERASIPETWSRSIFLFGAGLLAFALLLIGFLIGSSTGAAGGLTTPVLAACAIVFLAFLFCGLLMIVLGALLANPARFARAARNFAERARQRKATPRPGRRAPPPAR